MLVITVVFFNLAFPLDPQPLNIKAERWFINEVAIKRFSAMFDPCLQEVYSDAHFYLGL